MPPQQPPGVADKRRARQEIASVWSSAEAAFTSRAHPRSPNQSRATRAPRSVRRFCSGCAGSFPRPALGTELLLLPSLATSSTIRGVAPPLSPSPPPRPPELVLSFPLSLLPSSGPGSRAPQSDRSLSRLVPTPPRALPQQPPLNPPAARCLGPGLGVARPDSAYFPPRTRALGARPLTRTGRRALASRLPRASQALSRFPRRARSRPARSGLWLFPAPVSAVTALGNMATEGMILTNHDHQIRVGVLTGNRGRRSRTAAAAVPGLPQASRLW